MRESVSRILHVDNESVLLNACRIFLEQSGEMIVETTHSVQHAYELFRTTRFDVIISECQMTGTGGIELLQWVRSDPVLGDIPFIFFTGSGGEELVIEAINNGADFYLKKGDDPTSQFPKLLDTIRMLINRRKAEDALQRVGQRQAPGGDTVQPDHDDPNRTSKNTENSGGLTDQVFSYDFFQSLIEAFPEVIIITNLDGKVIFTSPRTWDIFDIPSETELTGLEIFTWIAPECHLQAFECITEHIQGKQRAPDSYRLLRSDGSSFPAVIHSAPVYGKDGGITGIIAIISDNSELSAQHDALERANTKLNLLSSITRHDILNKITALRLYCSLIEEEEDPSASRSMLKKVEEMASIISDIVAFTSFYQNLGINTAQWITPAEVVNKLVDMIEIGEIRIRNEFGPVQILADPLFEKVLYNLFDNAIKYGKTITTLTMGYELTGEELILIIADDGVGIPADHKEKIFERNVGHGTGLGLFLSREILSVTNLCIRERGISGKGARFEILIPRDNYQFMP